jgi:hypothetical protein
MSHRQRALAYSTECNSFPHSYRLRHLLPHRELGADYLDRLNADYLKRSLLKRLERLEVQVAVHNVVHPVTLPA